MNTTITITSQWQIYIPEKVRQMIGLTKPGKAELEVKKDRLVIKPKKSAVLKLAGKYKNVKPVKKIDIDNIRDQIDYADL